MVPPILSTFKMRVNYRWSLREGERVARHPGTTNDGRFLLASCRMDEDPVSKYLSEIGRKGGQARAKRLTPERRKEIATKASKAAAKVRSKKARKAKVGRTSE